MLLQSKFVVLALVLGLAPYGVAQERAGQKDRDPAGQSQAGQNQAGQSKSGQSQTGQSQTGQQRSQAGQERADEPGAPQTTRTNQDRATSDRTQQSRTGQQETSIRTGNIRHPMDAHLAACLLLGNQHEIAISKFAMEHAKNDQVKQFAQQMIAHHSKDVAELQKFVGPEVMPSLEGGTTGYSSTDRQRSTTTSTTTNRSTQDQRTVDQDRSRETNRSTATSDANRARGGEQVRSETDQSTQPGTRPGQSAQKSQSTRPGQTAQSTQSSQSQTTTQREVPISTSVDSYDHAQMATKRMTIEREVAQKCLELTKAELQKHADKFDHAYLGQQAGEHIQMIAKLEVYENHASPELKQLIQKSKSAAQDHLRQANELMEQNDSRPAGAARDATEPAVTNPAAKNPGKNR